MYSALNEDLSQESLTLSAIWILGEFGDALLVSGLVDEESPRPVSDAELIDLEVSVLDSPYANPLIRQFVLTSLTKIYARPVVSDVQRERIKGILDGFATSPELEIQQRSIEFESLFGQREIVSGVLEQMPAPEIKATVIGTGMSVSGGDREVWRSSNLTCFIFTLLVSENRTVGSTKGEQNVSLDPTGCSDQRLTSESSTSSWAMRSHHRPRTVSPPNSLLKQRWRTSSAASTRQLDPHPPYLHRARQQ